MNNNTKARRRARHKQRAKERQERRENNKKAGIKGVVGRLQCGFDEARALLSRSGSNLMRGA